MSTDADDAPARPGDDAVGDACKLVVALLAGHAPIAQLVELRTFNPQVPGSSPGGGTYAAS